MEIVTYSGLGAHAFSESNPEYQDLGGGGGGGGGGGREREPDTQVSRNLEGFFLIIERSIDSKTSEARLVIFTAGEQSSLQSVNYAIDTTVKSNSICVNSHFVQKCAVRRVVSGPLVDILESFLKRTINSKIRALFILLCAQCQHQLSNPTLISCVEFSQLINYSLIIP